MFLAIDIVLYAACNAAVPWCPGIYAAGAVMAVSGILHGTMNVGKFHIQTQQCLYFQHTIYMYDHEFYLILHDTQLLDMNGLKGTFAYTLYE